MTGWFQVRILGEPRGKCLRPGSTDISRMMGQSRIGSLTGTSKDVCEWAFTSTKLDRLVR